MTSPIFVAILSLSSLLFGISLFSGAQCITEAADSPPASTTSRQAEQPNIDDATLKKAAVAFPRVRQINVETSQALTQTSSEKERQQILAQAQSKQMTIVRNVGISVDQYNQVIQSVRNDPVLQTKFASYVKAANGGAH
jgi:hypothetical protein